MKKLIVLLFCIVIYTSCKQDTQQSNKVDTVLDIRIAKMPASLQPITNPTLGGREIYQQLFLPMADINESDLSLEPILLSYIGEVRKEGKNYVLPVEVREDATWEDGQPITAQDIAFTFAMIKHPLSGADQYRSLLEPIIDVMVDPSNVRKCKFVYDSYLLNIKEATLNTEILPKHIYDPKGLSTQFTFADLANPAMVTDTLFTNLGVLYNDPIYNFEKVIGSGPYKLESYEEESGFTLVKKENYWGSKLDYNLTKAVPQTIKYRLIPDELSALTALASGQIDMMNGVSASNYITFSDTSSGKNNMQLVKTQIPRYFIYYLNNNSPGLKDRAVRKALNCILDRNLYIKTFENGDATAMTSFVPSYLPGYNEKLRQTTCNVENAKILLKEGGWVDSNNNGTVDKKEGKATQELSLNMYASGELSLKFALLFKDAAAKAGININVEQKEFSVIQKEHLTTGKYDIIPSMASLDITMENPYDWYHSDNIGTSNLSNYSSPVADSLINIVRSTTDDKQRMKAFKDLQQTIFDDVAMIYIYSPKDRLAVNTKWQPVITIKRPGYRANLFRNVSN